MSKSAIIPADDERESHGRENIPAQPYAKVPSKWDHASWRSQAQRRAEMEARRTANFARTAQIAAEENLQGLA